MIIMKGIRKNYGGRMIFGDEKLTPLRATLRSRLRLGSFNRRVCGSGLGSPSAQIAPFGRNVVYAENVIGNSAL
jgi:hypothetical protein